MTRQASAEEDLHGIVVVVVLGVMPFLSGPPRRVTKAPHIHGVTPGVDVPLHTGGVDVVTGQALVEVLVRGDEQDVLLTCCDRYAAGDEGQLVEGVVSVGEDHGRRLVET